MKKNVIEFEKDHWFFVTSNILNNTHLFHKREYTEIVINSMQHFVQGRKLYIGAYVIMPNHIHLIVKSRSDFSLAGINRDFKKYTAKEILFTMKKGNENLLSNFMVNKSDRKKREFTYKLKVFINHKFYSHSINA